MKNRPKAMSLAEIMIVVTIVLILAAAAVSQTAGVQKLLAFQNVFQKTISFVQRTRTLAITKSDDWYGLRLENGINSAFIMLYKKNTATDTSPSEVDRLNFPKNVFIDNSACSTFRKIEFEKSTGAVQFFCGDNPLQNINSVTIMACQNKGAPSTGNACESQPIRQKSFILHKASGVPQLVQ